MEVTTPRRDWIFKIRGRTSSLVLALCLGLVLAVLFVLPRAAQGQTKPSWTYTILHSFTGGSDGSSPFWGLIRDAAGNLYGITSGGGAYGHGTVFKMDTLGNMTTLHGFKGGDGAAPGGNLIQDGAGALYGTTYYGGAYGAGVVYKLTASGKYKVLYNFTGTAGDGKGPLGGLVRDAAHNLYGTTQEGGAYTAAGCTSGCGSVFKLDIYGNETVLYSFTGGADGAVPRSGIIRDSAGNLYGSTFGGGFLTCQGDPCGTLFKLDASGNFTLLHSFGVADGANPLWAPLIRAGGNLYGTTAFYGTPNGWGTVFKLDSYSNLKVLHTFTGGVDGSGPTAGVIRTAAGSLFGTTYSGGAYDCGVVFKLDTTGKLNVLHNFTCADGANPTGLLLRDGDNNLYGTATRGGSHNAGVVFKLSPP